MQNRIKIALFRVLMNRNHNYYQWTSLTTFSDLGDSCQSQLLISVVGSFEYSVLHFLSVSPRTFPIPLFSIAPFQSFEKIVLLLWEKCFILLRVFSQQDETLASYRLKQLFYTGWESFLNVLKRSETLVPNWYVSYYVRLPLIAFQVFIIYGFIFYSPFTE